MMHAKQSNLKKLRLVTMILLGSVCSTYIYAINTCDVYGTSPEDADQLLKTYTKNISSIEDAMYKIYLDNSSTQEKMKLLPPLAEQKHALTQKIMHDGQFLYVDIGSTYYPEDQALQTTINVVPKNNPDAMKFVPNKEEPYSSKPKKDIINTMIKFRELAMQLVMSDQISSNIEMKDCPAYHCITTFEHPKTKPYLQIFNTAATKNRTLILNTLDHDQVPTRRGAAAFLVGHFTNPQEILTILSPHTHDQNPVVRNDVLRVIGTTLLKQPTLPINVNIFIDLLNSPFDSERNKALNILQTTASRPEVKKLLINHARKQLIALLRLQQRNNHRGAYKILQIISGENYGEYDISAWSNWLNRESTINNTIVRS